jgi:hypothetical protein
MVGTNRALHRHMASLFSVLLDSGNILELWIHAFALGLSLLSDRLVHTSVRSKEGRLRGLKSK